MMTLSQLGLYTTEQIEQYFEYNIHQGERWVIYTKWREPVLVVTHPEEDPKIVFKGGKVIKLSLTTALQHM